MKSLVTSPNAVTTLWPFLQNLPDLGLTGTFRRHRRLRSEPVVEFGKNPDLRLLHGPRLQKTTGQDLDMSGIELVAYLLGFHFGESRDIGWYKFVKYYLRKSAKRRDDLIGKATWYCVDHYSRVYARPSGNNMLDRGSSGIDKYEALLFRNHLLGIYRNYEKFAEEARSVRSAKTLKRYRRIVSKSLISAVTPEDYKFFMCQSQSIGFFQNPTSSVLAIDIDDHGNNSERSPLADQCFKEVLAFVNYESPLFIERSSENGGYHVFFQNQSPLSAEQIAAFETCFNSQHQDTNLKIETRKYNKSLRFILSCSYDPLLLTNLDALREGAAEELEFEPLPSIAHAFNFIINRAELKSNLCLNEIIYRYDSEKYVPEYNLKAHWYRVYESEFEPSPPEKEKTSKRKVVEEANNSRLLKNAYSGFPLKKGHRVKNQIALALKVLREGDGIEEFIEASIANNVDSKALTNRPAHEIRKVCSQIFQYASRKFKPTRRRPDKEEKKYLSNLALLTHEQRDMITEISERLVLCFGKSRYTKIEDLRKHSMAVLLGEVCGKMLFQETLSEKSDSWSIELARSTMINIQLEHGIKNLRALFDLLTNHGLLIYEHFEGKQRYSFGAKAKARHWRLFRSRAEGSPINVALINAIEALRFMPDAKGYEDKAFQIYRNNLAMRYSESGMKTHWDLITKMEYQDKRILDVLCKDD